MFSPATFFDVVEAGANAQRAGTPVTTDKVIPRPAVVAFYGFRGGAGRTLALAHTAALLARRDLRVVAIDLDVEAPGLHVALNAPQGDDGQGALALLRKAAIAEPNERLGVMDHLVTPRLAEGGRIWVLPAGAVSRQYLAEIEELGVGLWHARSGPSPVQRLIDELHEDLAPDFILIDCRTGFSGLSASVMFHAADLIVALFPLSEQVWDGLKILFEATHAAQLRRDDGPALVLVPSMIPPGEAGRIGLEAFLPRLEKAYSNEFGAMDADPNAEDPDRALPWLEQGVRYDLSIAGAGSVDESTRSVTWAQYQPLADRIASLTGERIESLSGEAIDAAAVLNDLKIEPWLAFGDGIDIKTVVEFFVVPENLRSVVDRLTSLVVGAKGAGKTWLFRALVNGKPLGKFPLPEGMRFIVGHAPGSTPEVGRLHLSPDSLKELERSAKMVKLSNYKAFWHFYALARLAEGNPSLGGAAIAAGKGSQRKALRDLVTASDATDLQTALTALLLMPEAGTLSERALAMVDAQLLKDDLHVTLVYDGLDTGFDSGRAEDWLERRNRFTEALLQILSEQRSRLRRLFYKIFLREDVYLAASIQNKSHLDAVKVVLAWRPIDLWRMTLNLVATSDTYRQFLTRIAPGLSEPWLAEEETLKRLLFPLWGETIEKSKTAKTANFVLNRIADADKRLFPRTLVQLVHQAVTHEKRAAATVGAYRVIRFTSLRDGIADASKQRLDDLETEYTELKPYLPLLEGMTATGLPSDFIQYMQSKLRKKKSPARKKIHGAEPGMLHAGPGGWQKVIDLLKDVGVLGAYRRGNDRNRLEVALLYRSGLHVRFA